MAQEIAGVFDGSKARIGIAVARFNSHIVESLLEGTLDGLTRHAVTDENITVARCPGCWELPLLASRMAKSGNYDAVITLGCVIRGDTPHFDQVCNTCSRGLADVGMAADIPVIFGVLTTDTIDQALNRAGIKHGNKGFDSALAALEMISLLDQVSAGQA